jgi:urease accessory protein
MTDGVVGVRPSQTAALLRLLAWLSPAFPTGGFAYSHGLEWAVETGDVASEAALADWLDDLLACGAPRSDAILLRHAHRAAEDGAALAELADLAAAACAGRERREETLAQGSAFRAAALIWCAPPLPDPVAYPVAVGAVAACGGVAEDDAAAAYVQALAANLISAAVRLVPLGQTAGLRVLAALEPAIIAAARASHGAPLDEIGGCAFRADLASLRHETQYTRLFRT